MDVQIPSSEQIRALLAPLTLRQLERLAEISGVPASTIYKIKRGETENPGVETLRKFMPHLDAARTAAHAASMAPPLAGDAAQPEPIHAG